MQFKGTKRPTVFCVGSTAPLCFHFNRWVEAQLALNPNLPYVPVSSNALPEDTWSGRTGFVHQAVLEDMPDLSGYQAYACGAPTVVDPPRSAYTKIGMPEEESHADPRSTA